MIKGPPTPVDHPDRGIDCEMSAEHEFQDLADRIEAVGWSGNEAAAALLSLALNHIEFRRATADDEKRISDARKKCCH